MSRSKNRSGSILGYPRMEASGEGMSDSGNESKEMPEMRHSLSVVLPARNEVQAIARTISEILAVFQNWIKDFEVIIVNDGSIDSTASIVKALAESDPHVRLVCHSINQGYGAALVSGFAAATKELTFFIPHSAV